MAKRVRPTVPKALRAIEDVLLRRDEVSRDLWNILSALRGPDVSQMNHRFKASTTVAIRRAAFPRLAKRADRGESVHPVGASFVPNAVFNPLPENHGHFASHARKAAKALRIFEG